MSKTSLFNNNYNFFTEEQIYLKFLNIFMKSGKKHLAEKILMKSCFFITTKQNTLQSIHFIAVALQNVKPLIELKSQQTGFRKKLMKPVPISSNRGYKLAID
jgi:ribosomal protein S7